MIRIVCSQADAGMAANCGGPVSVTYKTFDVELPELEAWLLEKHSYVERQCHGIEILLNFDCTCESDVLSRCVVHPIKREKI